jgi:hypothetical protein
MFTVEFDHDDIEITILDDGANHEDLKIHAFDDIVYLVQHDEELDARNIITLSPSMFEDLINAVQSPEGAFITMKPK